MCERRIPGPFELDEGDDRVVYWKRPGWPPTEQQRVNRSNSIRQEVMDQWNSHGEEFHKRRSEDLKAQIKAIGEELAKRPKNHDPWDVLNPDGSYRRR